MNARPESLLEAPMSIKSNVKAGPAVPSLIPSPRKG